MSGIAGSGGGAMEYQYNSPDHYGSQPTRCPEAGDYLMEHSSGSFPYPEHRAHDQRTGPNAGNTFNSFSLNNRSSRFAQPSGNSETPFQFTSSSSSSGNRLFTPNFYLPAPSPPRQSLGPTSTHHHSHSRSNFDSSEPSNSPAQSHPHPTPSDLVSTSLPPNDQSSISSSTSAQDDSDSSSSTQPAAPASHSEPTQSQNQGSTRLPVPRVRLPPPHNSRQRLSEDRPAEALGTFARYREIGTPEYEALHAATRQSSNGDSDGARQRWYGYLAEGRQSQILRGRFNGKRVASRKAVQSLEQVDVGSLDDAEKTCVICYNDFGVASPEGVVETPLRLPKCKHVFGDKCILQWLRESFHCPYCRDTLESEMAGPDQETIRRMIANSEVGFMPPSARRIVSRVDRSQTSSRSSTLPDRPEARTETSGQTGDREVSTDANPTTRGERRAAPSEDATDAQRRQRPRFADTYTGPEDLHSSRSSTASTHRFTRERPAQRTPAWEQSSQYVPLMPHGPHYFPYRVGTSTNYQLPPVTSLSVQGSYDSLSSNDLHRLRDWEEVYSMAPNVPVGLTHRRDPAYSTTFSRQLPHPDDSFVRSSFQNGHYSGSRAGS